MIISASRRTDIPAFYSEWFMNRIRDGYCTVPNPMNPKQVSTISLSPDDVDLIVFWTRNARPLIPYLDELDSRGYKYYFLYTLNNYPETLEPGPPSISTAINTIHHLADIIGPGKIIWRYDPIVFSNLSDLNFHKKNFFTIAEKLDGYISKVKISIVDLYAKSKKRFDALTKEGLYLSQQEKIPDLCNILLPCLIDTAKQFRMEITSCSDSNGLSRLGIPPGKCIDDNYIKKIFGISMPERKDTSQREKCHCITSRDIGIYDTCLYRCAYCYANRNFNLSIKNYNSHNPESPSLTGHYRPLKKDIPEHQGTLF